MKKEGLMMAARKEISRKKILHAAKVLFEKNGIDTVSFQQIANTANVCRTTVFNHFSGTRELMLGIVSQEVAELMTYFVGIDASGKDKVIALFDKLIEDTANYPTLTTRLINNAILSGENENPIAIIEQAACEAMDGDEACAVYAVGCYLGLITHYHIHGLAFEPEKMKDEFRRLFLGSEA